MITCRMCLVHLGADDSLWGPLNVGRQTKECRAVVLWESLNDAAVVLERQMQVTHWAHTKSAAVFDNHTEKT